jgi:hypothetical protein
MIACAPMADSVPLDAPEHRPAPGRQTSRQDPAWCSKGSAAWRSSKTARNFTTVSTRWFLCTIPYRNKSGQSLAQCDLCCLSPAPLARFPQTLHQLSCCSRPQHHLPTDDDPQLRSEPQRSFDHPLLSAVRSGIRATATMSEPTSPSIAVRNAYISTNALSGVPCTVRYKLGTPT